MKNTLNLSISSENLAICQLAKKSPIPSWTDNSNFLSITRTPDELSIVCPTKDIPESVESSKNWRALKVKGPLDFSLTGILAGLASPLANHKISIFAISTYDTDYILIQESDLLQAVDVLKSDGHHIDL